MNDCTDSREQAARAVVRLDLAARQYLGVPFVHQGRSPSIGIDCVGLLVLAARDCGTDVALHDFTTYSRNPNNGELERRLRAAFGAPVSTLAPGCVVAIDFHGQARHVAIVGEHPHGLSLIHTASNVGRVVEHGLSDQWRKRITGIYEVRA